MPHHISWLLVYVVLIVGPVRGAEPDWTSQFQPNPDWEIQPEGDKGVLVGRGEPASHLVSPGWLGDQIVEMEFAQSSDGIARVFLQGRYPVTIRGVDGAGWRRLKIRFRAPRFDEARNKIERAFLIDARLGEEVLSYHQLFDDFDPAAHQPWEDAGGDTSILIDQGSLTLRSFAISRADFGALSLPAESGGETNETELVDYVLRGREVFTSLGCAECHAVKPDDPAVKTGPNLFGLFTLEPRERDVTNTEGTLHFTVTANRDYLMRSVRESTRERAVAESGATRGEPYLPIMPPYAPEILSDHDAQAISSYLATLNVGVDRGPGVHLVAEAGMENYEPMEDRSQLLVGTRTRLQRGPMNGVSARSLHVGQTHGTHYTFDPRVLGLVKIWQGGFLDMSGEWKDRGGKGLRMGFQGGEISRGDTEVIFAPLHRDGRPVDFSFKEARFDDAVARRAAVDAVDDHLALLAAEDADFLGYRLDNSDPTAVPEFRYRVGPNRLKVSTRIADDGLVTVDVSGELRVHQSFVVNTDMLREVTVSTGTMVDGRWTIPQSTGTATLMARVGLADTPWRPTAADFDHARQPLQVAAASPQLPAGYAAETWLAPRDNFGRDQLFEPLGLAVASDGTLVVVARTGSIWRVVEGEWRLFAEGLFDALGVVIEDEHGFELVVGQKAELTRVRDLDHDGRADLFETISDDWSYHGNYHSYLHGPIRLPDGNYLVTFNLAHSNDSDLHKGEGSVMGATGGFTGWALRISPDGTLTPWADGLRSPAGLGIDPAGTAWYADNQGDFVATSKIHHLNRGAFYGHPAGLVDRPGMIPTSPQIKYDAVKQSRARAVVLIPQSRVANSLGNPVWDETGGDFGPFESQMYIGDQTQSVLLRVVPDRVDEYHQGAALFFGTRFESGIMRPVFLPDGSLLLGQTGRGWQAFGGHVTSLQRVWWDGVTVPPGMASVQAVPHGFRVHLTAPLEPPLTTPDLATHLSIRSWTYRDAPDYGSAELDERVEAFSRIDLADDRRSFTVRLARTAQPVVHPEQTGRVYHVQLDAGALWGDDRPRAPGAEAFYTLYAFPEETAAADHPDVTGEDWVDLLTEDLSNADFPAGIWWTENGELTASEDQMLWTKKIYRDFDLDLEFRTAGGTNSGVLFHVSDPAAWVQNSVEIQIADDYSAPWIDAEGSWQCGAIFGRLPAATSAVNRPGEWNRMTVQVRGKDVQVVLNGQHVIDADLRLWTSATVNPSGVEIPPWLSTPLAELPTEGRIGFQGKHAGAPVWFRNIRVHEVPRG